MQIPSYRQIAKYIIAFGGVHGLNILIGIIRNKIVSMLLGPSGLGLMALYQSGLKLIQDATNFGISQSGVRTIGQAFSEEENKGTANKELLDSIMLIRSWSMVAAIFGVLVCVVFAPGLSFISFGHKTITWGEGLFQGLDFMMLAPIVGLIAVSSGELAVLKAVRKLKKVASLSLLTTIIALVVSTPIFYYWREEGIIPSLLLTAMFQMIITICYSYSSYPPQLSFNRNFLRKGGDMIRLGIAFIIAGILGSGAEFIIRAFINVESSEECVGLYNAGYMMAVTYAGMAFAALESEYFPRLSTLCKENNKKEIKLTIIRQIKVSLMLIIPMVLVLIPLLPYIIPLLFSEKFVNAVPMAQITLLAMITRAVTLPMEYLTLAKGDSKSYLLLETVYDVLLVVGVCLMFHFFGIVGTGAAIVMASTVAMIVDIVYIKYRYL